MTRVLLMLPFLISCGSKVVEPATPQAECTNCGRAISIFTPLFVSSSWHATCEDERPGLYAMDRVEPDYSSCKNVKYTATLRCDGDACTSEASDDGTGFTVRASQPGRLTMHVVMTKPDGGARVVDLPPVDVYTPTAAKVTTCVIPADATAPIVEVHLVADDTQLEDDPAVKVWQKTGEPCAATELHYHAMNQSGPLAQRIPEDTRVFRCPTATDHLELEVETPGARFAVEASCDRLPAE